MATAADKVTVKEEEPAATSEEMITSLVSGISSLTNPHIKPRSFVTGENFAKFCTRFIQYVYLSKLSDPNLYLHFLHLLDDRTYQKLINVTFEHDSEKENAELFCKKYLAAYYPASEIQSRQTELLSCKQRSTESVDDYSFRLVELANIAFSDDNTREINSKIAFLSGIYQPDMRRKLNELELPTLKDAIEFAKRLERVDKMIADETYPDSQTTPKFGHVRNQGNVVHSTKSQNKFSGDREEDRLAARSSSKTSPSYSASSRKSSYSGDRQHSSTSYRGGTSRVRGNCWNCGVFGHYARDCWYLEDQSSNSRDHRLSYRPTQLN